jgi:hypothetical protein
MFTNMDRRKRIVDESGLGYESGHPDDISLTPLFTAIWRYRRVIGVGLGVTLAVFIALAVLGWIVLPADQLGVLSFRIEMEGAAKGEYPNGAKFSAEEIIATPVLTEVYRANELERYTMFNEFASSFLVENWSPVRDALSREYEAKLSDAKLTPVDRSRLETEFQNRLKAMATPEYRLSLRQRAKMLEMPPLLMDKVLQDVLRTWARHAAERKGALSYNVPVLSGAVIDWNQLAQDPVLGVDMLRSHVVRIIENVEELRKLPGADAIRGGTKQLSLIDVKTALDDLVRFKLEPLLTAALAANTRGDMLRAYFDNQLNQTRLKRDEAVRRVAAIEQGLQQYSMQSSGIVPTTSADGGPARAGGAEGQVIPQFGESFLDRLMQMSGRNEDAPFRQGLTDDAIRARFESARLEREVAYYESVTKTAAGRGGASDAADPARLAEQLKIAFGQMSDMLAHIGALYDQLSKNNLNPSTVLYAVTLPYTQQRVAPFTVQQAALWGVVIMILATLVLMASVILYDRFRAMSRARESELADSRMLAGP